MSYEDEFSLDDIFSQIETKNDGEKIQRIPFKFLDSYNKNDNDIFFGRDEEIEDIFRKFHSSKILLIYGRSGSGKSSVVTCGLLNKIPSEDIFPISIRCNNEPYDNFLLDLKKNCEDNNLNNPIDILNCIYERKSKPVLLVFDQFEEIFILSDFDKRKNFINTVKTIVENNSRVNFIFVIREEYLANLTEMEDFLPQLFLNRIRIEQLHKNKAAQVIAEPCRVCDIELEQDIIDLITERLTDKKGTIELTYLQVIMDFLYKKAIENNPDKIVIKKSYLDEIKNIGNVLTQFLDEQLSNMPDSEKGEAVLKRMISSEGTKKRITFQNILDDLHITGFNIDEKQLLDILQYFVNVRIISDKDENGNYELRHDSLADRIYDRMTSLEKEINDIKKFIENAFYAYQKRNKLLDDNDLDYIKPYEDKLYLKPDLKNFVSNSKKAVLKLKRRKQRIFFSIAVVLIVVMGAFSFWALIEKQKAEENLSNFKKSEAEKDKANYEKYLEAADKFMTNYQFDKAIENYQRALEFVPPDTILFSGIEAKNGIELANIKIIQAKDYFNAINKADSLFETGILFKNSNIDKAAFDLIASIEEYNNALTFDLDSVYPVTKINEANRAIDDIVKKYIEKAETHRNLDKESKKIAINNYLLKAKKLRPNNPQIDKLIEEFEK